MTKSVSLCCKNAVFNEPAIQVRKVIVCKKSKTSDCREIVSLYLFRGISKQNCV